MKDYFCGLTPELFLIFSWAIFLCTVAAIRYYVKNYAISHTNVLDCNMNIISAFWGFCIASGYFYILCTGIVAFHNFNLSVYSDGALFLFRVFFGILFIIYYICASTMIPYYSGHKAEYYFMLVAAFFGLNLALISANFLNLLLGIEIYSVALYQLLTSRKDSDISNEASLKYFLISSFSTAIFLLGAFVLYLGYGSFDYQILSMLKENAFTWKYVGYYFIIIALLVKVGAGIFYFWTLDAYEGAPFPILIFLTIFVKPVFIFIAFRIIIFSGWPSLLQYLFASILLLSSLVGALGAYSATGVPRFLIFTSIYNLGFLGAFLWSPATLMFGGFILFFFIYAMNSLAFMLLISCFSYDSKKFPHCSWVNVVAMAKASKPIRFVMCFFLFSLSGLPPFIFFFVKYYLLVKLSVTLLYIILSYILFLNAVTLFLYIRLVRLLWKDSKNKRNLQVFFKGPYAGILGFLTMINILLLFYIDYILHIINLFIIEWKL